MQTYSNLLEYDRFDPESRHPKTDVRFSKKNVGLALNSGRNCVVQFSSARVPQPTIALPDEVGHRSMTTLREKLIKIGAKMVRHGRYVTFQLAEVVIPRRLLAEILR